MMEEAKMFLAAERGLYETNLLRSYRSFNFGEFYNEHKAGFADLYMLNDETLAPGHSVKMHVDRHSYVVILPVVGEVAYIDAQGNDVAVQAGQMYISKVASGSVIELKNPFDDELVNFLQLRVAINDSTAVYWGIGIWSFDLNLSKNRFAAITSTDGAAPPIPVSIGKFDGRQELAYQLKNERNGVYAFVLGGAFELQNRLLHAKDGLAVWGATVIEAEALSNDAILLLLELPLKSSD